MLVISRLGGEPKYLTPPKDVENLIGNILPREMLAYVFSFLGDFEKQKARRVSKGWNASIIDTAKRQKTNDFKEFIDVAVSKLEKLCREPVPQNFSGQILTLKSLKHSTKHFPPNISLLALKTTLQSSQLEMALSIKPLDLDELKKEVRDPLSSDRTFTLARIYQHRGFKA